MGLEFTIKQVITEAVPGDKVSFSGTLVRVWDAKLREGTRGPFTTQGVMVEQDGHEIEYGHFISSKSAVIPQSAKGLEIHVQEAKYAPYEWQDKLRQKVEGDKYTIEGLVEEAPSEKGRPAKRQKIIEDYVTMACGFTVIWTEIMRRFELPPEAIDPIAKRVDTVTIQNNGINLDRVRILGQPVAKELVRRSIEFREDVSGEYEDQAPPTEPGVELVNAEEVQKMRELYELAVADGELTEEKMAKILNGWGATKLTEVPKEQFETVCAYLKEWRSG